jgi:serine/threonine protein kinase
MVDERPELKKPQDQEDTSSPEETLDFHGATPAAGVDPDDVTSWPAFSSGPIPESFAGYKVTKELHRGGQGVVYQAIQQSTNRKVAIKVMKEGPFAHPDDRARFEREVQILGQLQHPNIVAIHDSGKVAGCHYFVMDYISGRSLDEYIEERRRESDPAQKERGSRGTRGPNGSRSDSRHAGLSIDETLGLFSKICGAVDAAHRRGIVHRDLKPRNIFIDQAGEPHVLDFGLAKTAVGGADAGVMTVTGQFIGTLPWASPEQAEGRPTQIDVRTDVYALGVILYQMLTGRFPYEVMGNMRDVLDRIMNEAPARPSTIRRQINDEVETIVLKCLEKDKERRYQSAGNLGNDIARYLAGEPIEARRASIFYLVRTRTFAFVRRNAFAACVLIAVISSLASHWIGIPLVFRWTALNQSFDHLASSMLPDPDPAVPYPDIVVIALNDDRDLAVLGRTVYRDPDWLKEDVQRLRLVHGELMKRLAAAGTRIVAWNIAFRGASEFDDKFLEGVRAVQTAGGKVIVAAHSSDLTPDGLPDISPAIALETQWGHTVSKLRNPQAWQIPLVVGHGKLDPIPCLSVAIYATYRHPDMHADFRPNDDTRTVSVNYWKPSPDDPNVRIDLAEYDVIKASDPEKAGLDAWPLTRTEEDVYVPYPITEIRNDLALAESTLSYADVLTADPQALKRRLTGKIAIIGDRRATNMTSETRDGRFLWRTYAQTSAVDQLLASTATHFPLYRRPFGLQLFAAVVGLIIGWVLYQHRALRWIALVIVAGATIGLSLALAHQAGVFYNPFVAVFALLLAGGLAMVARGMYQFRRT